jgi:hypothetical protein
MKVGASAASTLFDFLGGDSETAAEAPDTWKVVRKKDGRIVLTSI